MSQLTERARRRSKAEAEALMMCVCGMQTWCEFDCPGPDGNYVDEIDAGLVVAEDYVDDDYYDEGEDNIDHTMKQPLEPKW